MKRIKLDTAAADVQQFVRGLPIGSDGIELELDGQVVCEVLPPHSVTHEERSALIARARGLASQARRRNQGVPTRVIDREVRDALDDVRRRKQ